LYEAGPRTQTKREAMNDDRKIQFRDEDLGDDVPPAANNVYTLNVVCSNCEYSGTCEIPRGVLVGNAECSNCGCSTLALGIASDVLESAEARRILNWMGFPAENIPDLLRLIEEAPVNITDGQELAQLITRMVSWTRDAQRGQDMARAIRPGDLMNNAPMQSQPVPQPAQMPMQGPQAQQHPMPPTAARPAGQPWRGTARANGPAVQNMRQQGLHYGFSAPYGGQPPNPPSQ
jgi:hypothetical protein